MARARNIKPGFFVNDELSECSPLARLMFIGLWTLADCEGRLKDRPRQIKAQLLPYDDCDAESLLINLEQSGFIQRYLVQGQPVIQILNFLKHQNPHKNERDKGSSLGTYSDRDIKIENNQQLDEESGEIQINPDKDGTNPADSLLLIPDSLNPITDPLITDSPPTESGLPKDIMPSKLDDAKRVIEYLNAKTGKAFKAVDSNLKLIRARMKEGHSLADIIAVIDRKCLQWPPGDKMHEYLRPSTLFGAEKFNQYVGEIGIETPEEVNARKLEEWASGGNMIEGEIVR